MGLGRAGGQLTAFSVHSLQDKWVLNHEDVLLGERIGRVSQGALVPARVGSVGGQGCPRGSAAAQGCPHGHCGRAGGALGHATASWASAPMSLGRVTLERCSAAACVLTTPPWL